MDTETLVRKKVSKKHYPPDTQAAKMLMELDRDDYIGLSDEELENEIRRLTLKFKGEVNDKDKG